jgi:glycosyltransferase involved in cell wall biosynthesis
MKFALICKRRYTNRDLLADRFGRLYHLPVQLARNGCPGTVLAADYGGRTAHMQKLDGVPFYSLPFSALGLVSFSLQVLRHLAAFQPDVIIASGDTHFGALGLFAAHRLGLPFVFDIYDDYRVFGTNRLLGMKTLFAKVVRQATLVITASQPLHDRLVQLNPRSMVIENGVDPALFKNRNRADARFSAGIDPHAVVLGYFGHISRGRGVQVLLDAAGMLQKEYPGLRLLLAGKRDPDFALDNACIDYRGEVSQADVAACISACNVAVIPYLPSPQTDVSNPCKVAEYLACGVPVVATAVSNIAELFAQAPHILCIPGDPADMARAIRLQLTSPVMLELPQTLTWEALGRRLADRLHILTPHTAGI